MYDIIMTPMEISKLTEKIIVILGPTSSGKSEAAIKLARKFNGEIISADSRQIYRGMDIGTGKVEPDRPGEIPQKFAKSKFYAGSHPFMSSGIPHHMLNIINPNTDYNAAKFKKQAEKIIKDILKRKKLPIVCGGTGFWIKAVVDNINFPEVKPNKPLRNMLRNKSAKELFSMLKKLDLERTKNIDAKNKVRLIRAIEIAKTLGSVPKYKTRDRRYDFLQIGIDVPKEKLRQNIRRRLKKRFEGGMIKEVENLRKKYKLSWKKIQSFGLGYFWIPLFLQKKISRRELFEKIYSAEKDYAKRQATWFRKDLRIIWLENYRSMEKSARIFLKK